MDGNRFIEALRMVVTPPQCLDDGGRKGIELSCTKHLLKAFVESPGHRQVKRIPIMAGSVVWIYSNRAEVLRFGRGPIVIFADRCKTESAPGFCHSRVEFNCFCGCQLGQRRRLRKGTNTKHTEPVVVISHARVSQGVIRVSLNSIAVTLKRFRQTGFGITIPVIPSSQVRLECYRAFGPTF